MAESYDPTLKARLTLDAERRVRGINHVDEFWLADAASPRAAAIEYLRATASTFDIETDRFAHAHQPVDYYRPEERDTEYRLLDEKPLFDATTEGFAQTHLNLPVWAAGVTVVVKHGPLRVVSATDTSLENLDAQLPSEDVLRRWREVFARAKQRKTQATGLDDDGDEGSLSQRDLVADVLAGRVFTTSRSKAVIADRERAEGAGIISGRFFVYRYDPDERLPTPPRRDPPPIGFAEDDRGRAEVSREEPDGGNGEDTSSFTGDDASDFSGGEGPTGLIAEEEPTLPLPPVPDDIRPGADYVVAELVFSYRTDRWGDANWRALVDVETGAILYLRSLAASVDGLVFIADPITESGNAANGPTATAGTLNGFRDNVTLPNLDAPVANTVSLRGSLAQVAERETPTVAAPTRPTGSDFDFGSRTNDFAAVNAYYHTDRFFQLVEDLGFPLATYFDGTTFPVQVDHRGLGNAINAHCVGNGVGVDHLCYALADATDTTNPIGIAADWRVHLHELGGHGILHDHVGGPNFGFAHSAGDSFAVILADPESQAPDRFVLAPFVPAVVRRHDRPVSTWAWGGPNDVGGYSSEQILSTTLFRVYRSIGGDSSSLGRRQFAARYMAYLMLRTVSTLTPATNPANATAFANAMIATDLLNWTSEGVFGGAYGKVIRWAFEEQGLFQPGAPAPGSVNSPGAPPAVDVYIDDGRAGEYQFQANHWSTTTIWNRTSPDNGTTHQSPILGQSNYAYVRIKNRGTGASASNVRVRGYHTKPGAGLLWPDDFQSFITPELIVGPLGGNNSEEKTVGPFEWTPNINAYGHDCILMVASATGDPSNVDNFVPGEVIPEWRLVPNDNNVGQRNVHPVPGGGGIRGLIAGLHHFPVWVGNPNPRRTVVNIEVDLPAVLAERGWKVSIEGLPSKRLSLDPRERRELRVVVDPGKAFEPEDIESARDRDIVITMIADTGPFGGMTYRLDPKLTKPVNPLDGRKPDEDERCRVHAKRLLDCLDLHGQDVSKVRVKKVTVDISMEGDCC